MQVMTIRILQKSTSDRCMQSVQLKASLLEYRKAAFMGWYSCPCRHTSCIASLAFQAGDKVDPSTQSPAQRMVADAATVGISFQCSENPNGLGFRVSLKPVGFSCGF